MTLPAELCPTYRTGDDFVVRSGPVRFAFSESDFSARVVAAAARLGFVDAAELDEDDRDDLVALAAHGRIDRDASRLAAHIDTFAAQLIGGDRDLVQWLRRLAVRDAWIDGRALDAMTTPAGRAPTRGTDVLLAGEPLPDLSELAFTGAAG